MITTGASASTSWIACRTSSPSTPFIRRSVSTASAGVALKRAIPAWPLSAASASKSFRRRYSTTAFAISRASSMTRIRPLDLDIRLLGGGGPGHADQRPLAGDAAEGDLAAVVANDACGDGEAQSRPFAAFLGGEERIEDRQEVLGGDPGAVVPHLDADALPGLDGLRGYLDLAALARGVAGVEQQVDEHLLKLVGVGRQGGKIRGDVDGDAEILLADAMAHQVQRALQPDHRVHTSELDRLVAREVEHLPNRRGDPIDLL